MNLTLVFYDAAGLAVLESGHQSDTGFFFQPVRPQRDAAVAEAGRYPQLPAHTGRWPGTRTAIPR
ncbi:MAG TPA: hypothetical protein VFX61_00920 [Micromonosporaceae bacterium]|nr:hypothetical protein [Micromonosporaceae bacterium]